METIEDGKKKFTLRELVDAIDKNGLPQIVGSFYQDEDGDHSNSPADIGVVTATCALGQAYVNLGVSNAWRHNGSIGDDYWLDIQDQIIRMNDTDRLPFSKIAATIRDRYPDQLDIIYLEGLEYKFTVGEA